MIAGYARVSTADQSLDRQLDALSAAGCERIWSEAASGKKGATRPQWEALLSHLRPGDVLVVEELSRLGRHVGDLSSLLDELKERRVGLRILGLGVDTDTTFGRMIFTVVSAVAQMERELLVERTRSGLEAARARGHKGGRRPTYGAKEQVMVRKLRAETRLTMAEIARAAGVSVTTAYRMLNHGGQVQSAPRSSAAPSVEYS